MQKDAPHLYSREAEEQFRQLALQNNQNFHQQQIIGGGPRPVFGGEKSALVQQIQALENGYRQEENGANYGNVYPEKAGYAEQIPGNEGQQVEQD
uniref:Uncharacterized protein n=1 Tax=Ditylenchus dipsaci TaxID=166011 RepID=A0A915CW09_9BILA